MCSKDDSLTAAVLLGFATEPMIQNLIPIVVQNPQLILTFAVVGSTWDDITNNCLGDSPRTTTVKVEALALAQELTQHTSPSHEAILIAGLNLLAGEMWSCDEESLRTHEQSIAILIAHHGGMRSLENQAVAGIAAV
jgi:hypothetical protein